MRDFAATDRINRIKKLENLERREKKLLLVQQVRSRYQENQYDMSNREQIMYGRTSIFDRPDHEENMLSGPEDASLSSFKLRLLIAIVLFGIVVYIDRSHTEIGGLTSEKLFRMISANYEEKIEDWVEAMSTSTQN